MDIGYSVAYNNFSGSIGTISIPVLGSLFTQAQLDNADAILITVSTADVNLGFGTTVGTGVNGGHLLAANTSWMFRGVNMIRQMSFISRGATAGALALTLFGSK